MSIPVTILCEDGRKPMTPEWLASRLAEGRFEDDAVPSTHEVCSWLGLVGEGWGELLRAGFPTPCTVAQMKEWFKREGWLDE